MNWKNVVMDCFHDRARFRSIRCVQKFEGTKLETIVSHEHKNGIQ